MSDRPRMSEEAAQALEESILHWRKNAEAETPEEASVDADDCALCVTFYETCDGCPVKESTGHSECRQSPYYEARRSFFSWLRDPTSTTHRDAFHTAARAELAFLESLRDPDAKS